MAKFLNTQGISYHLNMIIENANTSLYIISPFLQFNNLIKNQLILKNKEKLDFKIVFKKNPLLKWLNNEIGVQLLSLDTLHAKCYINEKEAIISSMNLHNYSQSNNYEMGIFISKDIDAELFGDIFNEVNNIIKLATTVNTYKNEQYTANLIKSEELSNSLDGYCIRTGAKIQFNIKKPFCDKAFNTWSEYNNNEYAEKYCHYSGEKSNGEICFGHPILEKYIHEAKAKYKFD